MTATVSPDADIHKLVPSISFKGRNISPGNKIAQDFSVPVVYTVLAEDGSFKQYTVIAGANILLYVGCSNGTLYALDPLSGRIKWQYNSGSPVSGPTYSNGNIYAMMDDGHVLALDAVTGIKKWQATITAGLYQQPVVQEGLITVTGALKTGGGFIYLLDQVSGTIIWQKPPVNDRFGPPSIASGIIFVPSFNYGLFAYNKTSGDIAWTKGIGIMQGNPIVLGNNIYFGGELAFLDACDSRTGAIKWANAFAGGMASAASAQGSIFSPAGTAMLASNISDGSIQWRFDLGTSGSFTPPSVTNGILVTGYGNGQLLTLNATTGKFIWQKNYYPYAQATSMLAVNGWIYFGLSDGRLLALDAATGNLRWTFQQTGTTVSNPSCIDAKGNAYHVAESGNQQ